MAKDREELDNTNKKKKDRHIVPALRTYERDVQSAMGKEGGGAEVKKDQVRELEKGKEKEGELKKEIRDLKKEALKLGGLLNTFNSKDEPTEKGSKERAEHIVEKEKLESAWKEFSENKNLLVEKGLKVKDLRNVQTKTEGKKKSALFIIIILLTVLFVFAGSVILISSIFLIRTPEEIIVTPEEITLPATDIFVPEKGVYVNITQSIDNLLKEMSVKQKTGIITEFIPYVKVGEEELQIGAQDLLELTKLNMPQQLKQSFSGYYLLGKYQKEDSEDYLIVLSTDSYSSTLVGMIAWQPLIAKDIQNLFPVTISTSQSTFNTSIIDNRDLYILDSTDDKNLFYYFFDTNTLIIIYGSIDTFEEINERIKTTLVNN